MTARAAGSSTDEESQAVLREVRRARHQEHPRPQGPDDLAAGQGRVRRLRRRSRGDRLQRQAQLHRRARRAAADRGLLLHGDAGAQRLRRPVGRRRRPDARPPEVLREGHGRAAVLGRRGQDAVRLRLRRSGSRSGRSRASSTGRCPTTPRSRTSRAWTSRARRRSSASTPRSCTTSRSPRSCRSPVPGRRAGLRGERRGSRGVTSPLPSPRAARDGLRPGARRADHHARLRRLLGRDRRRRRLGASAAADAAVRAELRLPDGRGRPGRGRPRARAGARSTSSSIDHYTGDEINLAVSRGDGFSERVPRRDAGRAGRAACAVSAQGAGRPAGAAARRVSPIRRG